MYIKHISQIWIRLVQCISIWRPRSIRYRLWFCFCLFNTNLFRIFHYLVDIHVARFQRELSAFTSVANLCLSIRHVYNSRYALRKFVALLAYIWFAVKQRLFNRNDFLGSLWATRRIIHTEDVFNIVVSLRCWMLFFRLIKGESKISCLWKTKL